MALLLASSSPVRRAMLEAAGIDCEVDPPRVDETSVKSRVSDPDGITLELAAAKSVDVSMRRPAEWVIGSDSVVSVAGRLFDKPENRDQAVEHLRFFSGKAMQLTSAVALARGGTAQWSHCDRAILHVRDLSDDFIQSYLDREWPEISYCVGVFRIEGMGVQLFDRIEGEHFTIQGMPLLALLGALQDRGVIAS